MKFRSKGIGGVAQRRVEGIDVLRGLKLCAVAALAVVNAGTVRSQRQLSLGSNIILTCIVGAGNFSEVRLR
jgi:hypothetical protein